MRRTCLIVIYQSVAVVATAFATSVAHSITKLDWFWAYLAAINLVTFAFFGFDKTLVNVLVRLKARVPEMVLVWGLAFPGGMLGAWSAMHVFRHKTCADKRRFRLEVKKAVLLQLVVIFSFGLLVAAGVASLDWLDGVIGTLVGLVLGITDLAAALLRGVLAWLSGVQNANAALPSQG